MWRGEQTDTELGEGPPGAMTPLPPPPRAHTHMPAVSPVSQPQEHRDRIEGEREVFFREERETFPTSLSPSQENGSPGQPGLVRGQGKDCVHWSPYCSPPGSLGHREREQLTLDALGTVPQALGGRLYASVLSSRGWWQQGVEEPSSSPWGPGCPRCHNREVCQALA